MLTGVPDWKAAQFRAAISRSLARVSLGPQARWGVMMQLGAPMRRLPFRGGSWESTSRAAPPTFPEQRASICSSSRIVREEQTYTSFPIAAARMATACPIRPYPMMPRVLPANSTMGCSQ